MRGAAAELRVPPYVESTGAGALRYLQLTVVGSGPERPAAQHDPRALVQAWVHQETSTACLQKDATHLMVAHKYRRRLICGVHESSMWSSCFW